MDGDPHDIDGFPLSLSEQFHGRTIPFTNIRPQSSATQDEDWYEVPANTKPLALGTGFWAKIEAMTPAEFQHWVSHPYPLTAPAFQQSGTT